MVDRRRDSSPVPHLNTSSSIACPTGMDESVFRSLPLDIQQQLAEEEEDADDNNNSGPIQLPPHEFNQLSESVRFDILRGQQEQLLRRNSLNRDTFSSSSSVPLSDHGRRRRMDRNDAQAAAVARGGGNRGRSLGDSSSDGLSALPDDVRFEVLRDQQEMLLRQASVRLGSLALGNPNDNITAATATEPEQLDPDGLNALPDDVRFEVLRDQQEMLLRRNSLTHCTGGIGGGGGGGGSPSDLPSTPDYNSDSGTAAAAARQRQNEYDAAAAAAAITEDSVSSLDPDGLNALPDDIRLEVLRNQQEQLLRQSSRRNVTSFSTTPPQNSVMMGRIGMSSSSRRNSLTNVATGSSARSSFTDNGANSSSAAAAAATQMSQDQEDGDYNGAYNESGRRHGYGQLIKNNGDRYEGQFWNGIYDGKGTLTFNSGTVYDGWWKMGQFQGHGTLHKNDGTVYTGNFNEGKQHGRGRCQFKSGDIYEGDWDRGSISGSGQYFFFDKDNFERTFANYDFDKFIPNNNIHYEGQFKDGFIHGFGRFYLAKGKSFEGSFHRGKRHGKGKYQKSDGTLDIYRFSFNKEVGDGVRWSKDRKKAWRISKGKIKGRMTLDEAVAHSEACGEAMRKPST